MAKVAYDHGLFNEDFKNQFLALYPEKTALNYRRIFLRSYPMEQRLEKDIYDFTLTEIEKFMEQEQPPSLITARAISSIINMYIAWAIEQGVATTNPIDTLLAQVDWPHRYVVNRPWLTEEQVARLADACENAQDAVILHLLFEGVGGKALQEIINLTIRDVDIENCILTLRQEYSTRTLKVSEKLIKMIRVAYSEAEYVFPHHRSPKRAIAQLIPSEYVVRPVQVGRAESPNVNRGIIWGRVDRIGQLNDMELSIKSLQWSGMLHMAHNLFQQHGRLSKPQYEQIAATFAQNFWESVRTNIDMEKVELVYGKVAADDTTNFEGQY